MNQVIFLGNLISLEGLKIDSQKIEAIESWERPKTASKVRNFLGLVGYYRHFVEGFSKIVHPLTELTHKAARFEWTEECKKSFQELKCGITIPHVLALPTHEKEFEIFCDASRQGLVF